MSAEFRQLLEDGDVDGLRRGWSKLAPHLPQPKSRAAAEITMHIARTAANRVTFPKRAYSHAWLTERGHPSQLPDLLRPAAERMYPRVAEIVGMSVNFRAPFMKPAKAEVEAAMADAVEDCYASKTTEPNFVRARMLEVKDRAIRTLFGRR